MFKLYSALLVSALAAPLCLPAHAAQQFSTYEEAQKSATDTGYIVFIYPSGWDRFGEKLCKKLIADPAVRAAAGDAALLAAPILQHASEAEQAKAKKIMGALGYPGDMSDISYPAIVFYEKCGRQYATLHGRELMRGTTEEIAAGIAKKLKAKAKQDSILVQANAATDPAEKARHLLESSRVDGLEWPGGLRDAMQKADPGDKHGYLAVLNFGFGINRGESAQDTLKRLDAVLKDKRYTNHQKQRACAVAIGHLRRSMGTVAAGPYITKYARVMQKLDPKSPLGLSAPVVMRDWVQQYHYGQGWSPEFIPGSENPMLMQNPPITKPGTYAVEFKITTGRDALNVKKVRLLDGTRCVAEDATPRNVTWTATTQIFSLNVKKTVKKPVLEITYSNDADHRSTWGSITVNPM